MNNQAIKNSEVVGEIIGYGFTTVSFFTPYSTHDGEKATTVSILQTDGTYGSILVKELDNKELPRIDETYFWEHDTKREQWLKQYYKETQEAFDREEYEELD